MAFVIIMYALFVYRIILFQFSGVPTFDNGLRSLTKTLNNRSNELQTNFAE